MKFYDIGQDQVKQIASAKNAKDINNIVDTIADFRVLRPQSRTGRKFTGYFEQEAINTRVSIGLDWLHFMVEINRPEPDPDAIAIQAAENIVIEYKKIGNRFFKHGFTIYLEGEPVADLYTHTRNEQIIEAGTGKLEIKNHILWTNQVNEVITAISDALNITRIKHVSELHIALDGANHVHRFLNMYFKQNPMRLGRTGEKWSESCRVRMKGKATFDAKRLNKETGMFDNFKIGSGEKYFTIYNKSQELEHSRKEYIRDVWKKAEIDLQKTVWRVELRLRTKAIKRIKDLDLSRLQDPNYLLQIFRTEVENFFQFIYVEKDTNVSRAPIIDLFQFEKLKVPFLDKIPRLIVAGAYKAQMAIHNAYANVLKGYYTTVESIGAAMTHIDDNIKMYRLTDWFVRKRAQWQELYTPQPLLLRS